MLRVSGNNMTHVRMELKSLIFLEDNRNKGHIASSMSYEIPCLIVISLLKSENLTRKTHDRVKDKLRVIRIS